MPRYLLFLTILSITTAFECNAQLVNLSSRSLLKLNKASSGRERILKYYKYFRRDSLKNERALLRKFRKSVDSTLRAERRLPNLDDSLLRGMNLPLMDSAAPFRLNSRLFNDSVRLDTASMKPEIFDRINANNDFSYRDKVPRKLLSDFDLDSIRTSVLPDNPVKRIRSPHGEVEDRMTGHVNELKSEGKEMATAVPDLFAETKEKLASTDGTEATQFVKTAAKEELETLVSAKFRSAQQQIATLLSRYRKFSSSDSTFVGEKRSSLRGKSFKERIFIGVNFNALTLNPAAFNCAPQLGYKFNRDCFAGAALVCNMMLEDTVKNQASLHVRNSAYRVFGSINLPKSFFGYAEGEASRVFNLREEARKSWRITYYAGLGRRFLVHPKLYFNVLALYKFSGEDTKLLHPDRFQCRIGLALSELAMRRRNIKYNPNR